MLSKPRSYRPSHATVVAYLALFVALGGSSYAAIKITGKDVPKDALTGADIKKLTGKDVTNNSLTGADVRNLASGDVANGRLLAEDFAPGQLPQGDKGDKGDKGDEGAPGATNVIVRTVIKPPLSTGQFTNGRVFCAAGERAVGGGAGMLGSNAGNEELQQSYPVEADQTAADDGEVPVGWESIIKNNAANPQTPVSYAVCASP